MQWTDLKIITDKKYEDIFDFVSAEVCPMGVQIEDYSDLEQQVEEIAHVDLIEADLLEKNRSEIIVHHYISPELDAQNARLTLESRLDELGVEYRCEVVYINQEDWETGWKKYKVHCKKENCQLWGFSLFIRIKHSLFYHASFKIKFVCLFFNF